LVCGTMSLAALEALIAGVKVRCEVVERDRLVPLSSRPERLDIGRRLCRRESSEVSGTGRRRKIAVALGAARQAVEQR
jgi:hypothetical protein